MRCENKKEETMRDNKQEIEFHITVNGLKLEEIRARDGRTYIVMPLFSKVSYGVEFQEEIKGHGATESVSQKWPVCPYQVFCRNLSGKIQRAMLFVDGQLVGLRCIHPYNSWAFQGISKDDGIHELLFSLPRFVTLKEKSGGSGSGAGPKRMRANDIGTVKIVCQEVVEWYSGWKDDYREYTVKSFTQANKLDAKATGGGAGVGAAGSGNGTQAHASTTRAGRVVDLNEPRRCWVTYFHNAVGQPVEMQLLYRTQHHLEEMGVLEKIESAAESAERKSKRERRRKRARLQRGSSYSTPVVVEDVKTEGRRPPMPTDKKVIVL